MIADEIMALLDTLTKASLNELVPARRRQFAQLCRHWAAIAERGERPAGQRPGVLSALRNGERPE